MAIELACAIEFTPEEQAWINANPIIKVGGETDWAPFDFADAEGRHTGIVADYLDLVSARTGLQFEVRLDFFSNLVSTLDSGDIDLLPATYFSEERASRLNIVIKSSLRPVSLVIDWDRSISDCSFSPSGVSS